MSTTSTVGKSYDITVTNGKPYDLDQCGVWVDWNRDEIFSEDELIVLEATPGTDKFTGTISPPPGAVSGVTKMRVRITYTGALNPCGNTTFGEVEDYSLYVEGWLDIYPLAGIVLPGDTNLITVNFNSVNLDAGYYSANVVISSNDPLNSIIEIPLTLRVEYIIVEAFVDLKEVCPRNMIWLTALSPGIYDTLIFAWTSIPEGFSSNLARVSSEPLTSTWFIVEASDGEHISTDSVYVHVYDSVYIDLGSDTSFCGSTSWLLDAGNTGSSYLWSTGDTTQTIVIDTTNKGYGIQSISVEATDTNNCTGYGEISIEFINCTNIFEMQSAEFRIFPNPNSGQFYIETNNIRNKYFDLTITSTEGKVVYQEKDLQFSDKGNSEINIGKLKDGIYLIILSSNGIDTIQKMILINK